MSVSVCACVRAWWAGGLSVWGVDGRFTIPLPLWSIKLFGCWRPGVLELHSSVWLFVVLWYEEFIFNRECLSVSDLFSEVHIDHFGCRSLSLFNPQSAIFLRTDLLRLMRLFWWQRHYWFGNEMMCKWYESIWKCKLDSSASGMFPCGVCMIHKLENLHLGPTSGLGRAPLTE